MQVSRRVVSSLTVSSTEIPEFSPGPHFEGVSVGSEGRGDESGSPRTKCRFLSVPFSDASPTNRSLRLRALYFYFISTTYIRVPQQLVEGCTHRKQTKAHGSLVTNSKEHVDLCSAETGKRRYYGKVCDAIGT